MDQAAINAAITAPINPDSLATLKDYHAAATMANTEANYRNPEVVAKRLAWEQTIAQLNNLADKVRQQAERLAGSFASMRFKGNRLDGLTAAQLTTEEAL